MQRIRLYLLLALGFASHAHATDIIDVYHQALENDPIFKAAYSTFMAKSESVPQARAALLPQIMGGAQVSRNKLDVTAMGSESVRNYTSKQWQLNASQPLFNHQSLIYLKQAKASVKTAYETFNDAAQNVILRAARAYFDLLYSQDTLNFARAKLRANKRQLDRAQQRFDVGVDTITSAYEAKAAYDQSAAATIAAENNQINQQEELRKLTNHSYEHLSVLNDQRIPLNKLDPKHIASWAKMAVKQNHKLLAAQFSLTAARENLKAQAAGHAPTFALQGNTTRTQNSGVQDSFFAPSNQNITTAGVVMNFPVYQGGLVHSRTNQARYDLQTAHAQLEQVYRDIMVNLRIAFNEIVEGTSQVKADKEAVISQQKVVQNTEAQYDVGTRTMVDVVRAQQNLFEVQQKYAGDQYQLVMAMLKLKYLAGTLNGDDLAEVNTWLTTPNHSSISPTA